MTGVDPLAGIRVAVLGLDVTTGRPPQITEVSVVHIDSGVITAGPLTWRVQPDALVCEVRPELQAELRLAPPWEEVADRVVEELPNRVLVVHDLGRWEVLRAHLPDWQPAGQAFTDHLARRVWPGLASYDLQALTRRAGIDLATGGAGAEAHAVALLLLALARAGGRLSTSGGRATNDD